MLGEGAFVVAILFGFSIALYYALQIDNRVPNACKPYAHIHAYTTTVSGVEYAACLDKDSKPVFVEVKK